MSAVCEQADRGRLVLYDVTSLAYEGKTCPLARWGYPRDKRRGKPQLLVGLVTSSEGCPVAVEVFPGNTADPMTLAPQVQQLRRRFGLQRVVVVGDRGMN
jgi:transposase